RSPARRAEYPPRHVRRQASSSATRGGTLMRKPTAAVLVAIAAVTLAAGAAAGPDAAKQRVAIQGHGAVFELKPLTSGDIKSDAGAASFCCWTVRTVV